MPSNYFFQNKSRITSNHAAGHFTPHNNMSSCGPCDAGRYAAARAYECLQCKAGFAAKDKAAVSCAACVAGKVAPVKGTVNCTECDAGNQHPPQTKRRLRVRRVFCDFHVLHTRQSPCPVGAEIECQISLSECPRVSPCASLRVVFVCLVLPLFLLLLSPPQACTSPSRAKQRAEAARRVPTALQGARAAARLAQ
jgi:hypothetical protein